MKTHFGQNLVALLVSFQIKIKSTKENQDEKITLLKTFIALVAVVIMSAAKTLNAQKTITNLGVNPSFQTSGIAVVQEDLREIKPNETVEGTIKPGEIQSFKIKLEAGQSISIPILNTNVPIRLSSFTPNGELQSEIFVMGNLLNEPVIIIQKLKRQVC